MVPRYKEIFQENSQKMSLDEVGAGFCLVLCCMLSYMIPYIVLSTTKL